MYAWVYFTPATSLFFWPVLAFLSTFGSQTKCFGLAKKINKNISSQLARPHTQQAVKKSRRVSSVRCLRSAISFALRTLVVRPFRFEENAAWIVLKVSATLLKLSCRSFRQSAFLFHFLMPRKVEAEGVTLFEKSFYSIFISNISCQHFLHAWYDNGVFFHIFCTIMFCSIWWRILVSKKIMQLPQLEIKAANYLQKMHCSKGEEEGKGSVVHTLTMRRDASCA